MKFNVPTTKFDQGVQGRYHASHAEAQMAALASGSPMGVSNAMCTTCQSFLSAVAQYRVQIQVVADPYVTRIFYPDGSIRTAK